MNRLRLSSGARLSLRPAGRLTAEVVGNYAAVEEVLTSQKRLESNGTLLPAGRLIAKAVGNEAAVGEVPTSQRDGLSQTRLGFWGSFEPQSRGTAAAGMQACWPDVVAGFACVECASRLKGDCKASEARLRRSLGTRPPGVGGWVI